MPSSDGGSHLSHEGELEALAWRNNIMLIIFLMYLLELNLI